MSCWLVQNGHISILVNAAAQYGAVDTSKAVAEDLRALGQVLWTENRRSVNFRYGERKRHPSYVLETSEAPLNATAVLKALDSWTYQSCERPDFRDSQAYRYAENLREAIQNRHPELFEEVSVRWDTGRTTKAYRETLAYEDAPTWSASSLDQAAAHNYSSRGYKRLPEQQEG